MEQNSVNTAPQPPSAFMPRKWACAPGLSAPGPAQCEVCQNRLRSVLGPILIGSNNTSCLGSRDIFLFLYNFRQPPAASRQPPAASRCAHHYPRSPCTAVALACYARLSILSGGGRRRMVDKFYDLYGKNCVGHGLDHRDR